MIPERVLDRVRLFPQGADGECWEWPMSRGSHGYGQIGWHDRERGRSTMTTAQRASWEAFRGPIPDDMTVDHLCRNRACWNPVHLRLLSLAENGRDGSPNTSKTHCPQGHRYDDRNTYVGREGWRQCRACNRDRARERSF